MTQPSPAASTELADMSKVRAQAVVTDDLYQPFLLLQELEESKQETERVQTELRTVKESFGKAQTTIRAARSRIQNITSEKEQVRG